MKSSVLTLVVIVLVISSAAAIIWTSNDIEGQVSRRVATSLETVLNTTRESLRIWQQQTIADAAIAASSTEIRGAVQKQLGVPHQYTDLIRSATLQELRQRLDPYVAQHGYVDFDVIAADGIQIGSGLDDFLGQSTLAKLNPDFVHAIFAGGSTITQPFEVPTTGSRRLVSLNLAVGVPVLNNVREVIAALVFRLDATRELTRLTTIGRLGRTGDIYVFDRYARLLTTTRFQAQTGTDLRDPGGDTTEGFRSAKPREQQPLTRMALAATRGNSGIDLAGYRDYRGVPVVGSWAWEPELDIGLAAEMEVSEAFAPLHTIRALSFVMIVVVTTSIILLMRVAAHRALLQATNSGYQQALKARQDILAIVAHDLKNPINSVALSSSVLANLLQSPQPNINFIVQNLGVIHRSAFRMNRLIEDLLTSTSIETGQFRIRPQECDLPVLLQEFEQIVFPLLSNKSMDLVCSLEHGIPKALADPDRLMQILSNLVGNAIKYTPPDGVVGISVSAGDGEVKFSVKDSGPGILSSELPRIFDQYWQGQHNRGGSGLGLYISKAFVEAHGGRIWIESAVGEGTTVYFTIPVALAASETSQKNDPAKQRISL